MHRNRYVLDLQSLQSESRFRGIGRYSLNLAEAMARQIGDHELWIVLSGMVPELVEPIRARFDSLVPQERMVVFDAPGPVMELHQENAWRVRAGEYLREHFLAAINPDVVHISSLFEGFIDNVVSSIDLLSTNIPTAVTLYDLIPLLQSRTYLVEPLGEAWYLRKAQTLKRATCLLAISESSKREAVDFLHIPDSRIINISCGLDAYFRPVTLSDNQRSALLHRYGITLPFILYSGAIEPRKNLDGLVKAFALLPPAVREGHQLVFVGKHDIRAGEHLQKLARANGVRDGHLILPGYVAEEDLVALYSLCAAFVLPSFHEGFGLPLLEAMACGAPAVGSNNTSIPEVLGRSDALFDPEQPASISAKLNQVLTDNNFRSSLREHGLQQAQRFTWTASASKALAVFEELSSRKRQAQQSVACSSFDGRPRLAYVSPLQPEESGIADYSAELLPALDRYYKIEVITRHGEFVHPWIKANFPVRDLPYFDRRAADYERVLYHFGNSSAHAHMFSLLQQHPGTVVLHDFFMSDVLDWMEWKQEKPGLFLTELYSSHGYPAVAREAAKGRIAAVATFPCNRSVLDNAAGVIVHSEYSKRLAEQWYGLGAADRWQTVPLLRERSALTRDAARRRLGLKEDDFVVCSFGLLTPAKMSDRLLSAWLASDLSGDLRCSLVFVGKASDEYGIELQRRINSSPSGNRIRITGFADRQDYQAYLSAADVAAQLRCRTRGETSAAILDCLSHGVCTIVNAHGSAAELPDNALIKLPDHFEELELRDALQRLYKQPELRSRLSKAAREYMNKDHGGERVALLYRDAIESFHQANVLSREQNVMKEVGAMSVSVSPSEDDLLATASSVANVRGRLGPRRLLLDVTGTSRIDLKTGIQRVARHVLLNMIEQPPAGFVPESVNDLDGTYTYARKFTFASLNKEPVLPDSLVAVRRGDIWLGLDISPDSLPAQRPLFEELRAKNIPIFYVVYDLLPILKPALFPSHLPALFRSWLETVCEFASGLICISRSVADELLAWLDRTQPARCRPLAVGYFHLGADVNDNASTKGLPDNMDRIVSALQSRPTLLMVGTLEPRKGHAQALAAFEQLWSEHVDVNLVILGQQGWNVDSTAIKLREHKESQSRLFWFSGGSDELLEILYSGSSALLAASEGEGFGLPIIEAARHKIPLIARDIPVFREVATDHAYYFTGTSGAALAGSIRRWLDLHAKGLAPSTEGLPWLTWSESVEQLLDVVLRGRIYREWAPSRITLP